MLICSARCVNDTRANVSFKTCKYMLLKKKKTRLGQIHTYYAPAAFHTNTFPLGYTELNSGLQGTWVGIHFDSFIKLQGLTKRRRKLYAGGLQCLRDTCNVSAAWQNTWVSTVKLILLPRCVHSSQTWKEQQDKRFLKKTVESSRVSAAALEVQRKTQQCKRRLLCQRSGFTTHRGLGSEHVT